MIGVSTLEITPINITKQRSKILSTWVETWKLFCEIFWCYEWALVHSTSRLSCGLCEHNFTNYAIFLIHWMWTYIKHYIDKNLSFSKTYINKTYTWNVYCPCKLVKTHLNEDLKFETMVMTRLGALSLFLLPHGWCIWARMFWYNQNIMGKK